MHRVAMTVSIVFLAVMPTDRSRRKFFGMPGRACNAQRDPMHRTRAVPRWLPGLLAALPSLSCHAATPAAVPPGVYDLTTQTVLPHLEEALRYATTRARRCLRDPDATSIFPLLEHPAFSGCRLVRGTEARDGRSYTLRCSNPEAASGSAVLQVDAGGRVRAVLEVKMGGKNMTLSQRLHGPRVGPCAESGRK
jgi:hypothetical protein